MKALLPLLLVLLAFGAPAGAETIAIPIHNGGAYADGLEGAVTFESVDSKIRLSTGASLYDGWAQLASGAIDGTNGAHGSLMIYDSATGLVFVHGGYISATSNRYALFNVSTMQYVGVSFYGSSSFARERHAGFTHNGKIYLVGGTNRSLNYSLDTLPNYDIAARTWGTQSTTNYPTARYGMAYTKVNNTVYIFGGAEWQEVNKKNDLWKLDLSTWEWTQLHDGSGVEGTTVPYKRAQGNMIHANGKLYLTGGPDGGAEMWVWDLAAGTWTEKTSCPVSLGSSPAAVYDMGKIYYLVNNSKTLYEYSISTDSWAEKTAMPTAADTATLRASTGYENMILLWGGWTGSTNSKQMWIYGGRLTTSPATTGAWTPLPQGTIDMSTARLVVLKNGVVQAETDTSVKCQYAANGGALNGTWLTLSALRAVSDITVTDTTNSLKLTCQFNSNGSDAVEAEYAMQFEFTPTGGGGASTGNVNSGFNEPLGVRRMF